jgi:hypothetical protein
MAAEISALLSDAGERHRRESGDHAKLDNWTWDAMAQRQLALYRQLAPRVDRLQ